MELLGMKRNILFLVLMVMQFLLHAQITFEKKYGVGTGYSLRQLPDSGFIIAGMTVSSGNDDLYLIRTDKYGEPVWEKTYGGSGNDCGYSIDVTHDGAYIITGVTESFGVGSKDLWLLKINIDGDTLWTKTLGGLNDDWGRSIALCNDNGFIITGTTFSYGPNNLWLIKTDAFGDTLWTKIYSSTGYTVKNTFDGGYIIGKMHGGILKTDINGDTIWNMNIPYNSYFSVSQAPDSGYLISSWVDYYPINHISIEKNYYYKTDSNGNIIWSKIVPIFSEHCKRNSIIIPANDDGYIIAGSSSNPLNYSPYIDEERIYLVKTDINGGLMWRKIFGFGEALSVISTNDGGYAIIGHDGYGSNKVYLIKIDTNGDVIVDSIPSAISTLFPNPATETISLHITHPKNENVSLYIFDRLGRRVVNKSMYLKAWKYDYEISVQNISKGMYFIKLEGKDWTSEIKFIKD
jgi:hypothetical protein